MKRSDINAVAADCRPLRSFERIRHSVMDASTAAWQRHIAKLRQSVCLPCAGCVATVEIGPGAEAGDHFGEDTIDPDTL